ncbi:type III-A CRISPR-associated RAMP protein Csm4, partial [Candidatus Hakubella thermalkaliphila]
MNNYTVYLKNPTPFLNELPKADTIFGALCWGLKTLYSETTLLEFINSYLNGDIPVLISSTFPFVEEDGCKHHFFPKPLLKPLNYNKEGVVSNKDK